MRGGCDKGRLSNRAPIYKPRGDGNKKWQHGRIGQKGGKGGEKSGAKGEGELIQ